MKDLRAGVRYARALLELAVRSKQLERIDEELNGVRELTQRHPEISHLLRNATISREEKEDFIEKVLPRNSSKLLIQFLKVLVRKRRFQDLAVTQEEFHRLFEERLGIQRVRVETAVPLNEALEEKLRRVLQKKLNRTIRLETVENAEILGGLILDFKGTQIDGSFRTVLHELKQKLLPLTLPSPPQGGEGKG